MINTMQKPLGILHFRKNKTATINFVAVFLIIFNITSFLSNNCLLIYHDIFASQCDFPCYTCNCFQGKLEEPPTTKRKEFIT